MCLISLTQHTILKAHPYYCSLSFFFITEKYFHFMGILHFYPFVSWWTYGWCDFQFGDTVNTAARNHSMQVFVWTYIFIFLRYLCRNTIAKSYIMLYLTFWGTARLFSKVAASFYIHASHVWGFHFLYIFTNTGYYLSFW